MRPHKSIIMIALVAFILAAFVAAMAQQSPAQTDQKKQGEACCAMESCCCNGDSCPMKTDGTANSEAKDGCCGDSCDMAKHEKHDKKNHPAEGSCCNMKHKDMKQKDKKQPKAA